LRARGEGFGQHHHRGAVEIVERAEGFDQLLLGLSETVLFGLESGWGADHLHGFPERLRAVDAAQLDRVLRACFVPEAAQVAIAGPFDAAGA
jgi:hypothetical protein